MDMAFPHLWGPERSPAQIGNKPKMDYILPNIHERQPNLYLYGIPYCYSAT